MTDEADPRLRELQPPEALPPSWNIAPSRHEVIVGMRDGQPVLAMLEWGFHPPWAKPDAPTVINARIETAAQKPYFRRAWRDARVLVPADGWYEWQVVAGKKMPRYIHPANDQPMFFAGLSDENGGFAIVTTAADGDLREIHDRRPVALQGTGGLAWLTADDGVVASAVLCEQALPAGAFSWHAVAPGVNRPGTDGPELVAPL